jgi:putative ATPase
MEITVGRTTIRAAQGDLTALDVDAVVNAANERLAHGGGLAAALVRAGGRVIQDESDAWVLERGPLTPGTAAVTGAGDLPATSVVHVAGPVYRQDRDNEELLRKAVDAALAAAAGAGHRSVAMPALSAGIFGYPVEEATGVISSQAARWAEEHPNALHLVLLVGYDEATAAGFAAGLRATDPSAG